MTASLLCSHEWVQGNHTIFHMVSHNKYCANKQNHNVQTCNETGTHYMLLYTLSCIKADMWIQWLHSDVLNSMQLSPSWNVNSWSAIQKKLCTFFWEPKTSFPCSHNSWSQVIQFRTLQPYSFKNNFNINPYVTNVIYIWSTYSWCF